MPLLRAHSYGNPTALTALPALPLPVRSYEGFEMQWKHDVRYLAQDYVLAITAMLGKPRADGLDARTIFR